MATGTVKWFNAPKGYGVIVSDIDGEELFAHFTRIRASGFRTLHNGEKVRFEIDDRSGKRQACRIEVDNDACLPGANNV